MAESNTIDWKKAVHSQYDQLHRNAIRTKLVKERELFDVFQHNRSIAQSSPSHQHDNYQQFMVVSIIVILCIAVGTPLAKCLVEHALGVRCLVPNNYLIWEATRPISNCGFCAGITRPRILPNITREQFLPFAYSSEPIIIKNAVSHWPAARLLNFNYLKRLYEEHSDALDTFSEECQFLHFRSSFGSLRDFFQMPTERALTGNPSWYVGFSNCQSRILHKLRQLYPRPHFLPIDAEIPNTDYIFLGYDQGAVMHLDYIPRLMWQAQLQGNKTWTLSPTPECDKQCATFSFYVEPGDAVLIDTRVWYHGTKVSSSQFSLTIQSEYG